MRLAELQALFFRYVTNVDGAAAAHEATGVAPQSFVAGDARLSAAERLDIFSEDYGNRLLNVLRDFYEQTERYIGEQRFVDLMFDYLQAHPPTSYSLRDLGRELPALTVSHRFAEAFPALPDLVRLEWTMHALYDGPDEALRTADDLRAVKAHEWATLRLPLIANHERFTAAFDVCALWEDPESAPAKQETHVLVWRHDGEVYFRSLAADERLAIDHLGRGATFGETCEALSELHETAAVAQVMLGFLNRWLGEGLLRA